MWLSQLLGMCMLAEVTLMVHFRERNDHGDWLRVLWLHKEWSEQEIILPTFECLRYSGTGNATQVNTIYAIDSALTSTGAFLHEHPVGGHWHMITLLLYWLFLIGGIKTYRACGGEASSHSWRRTI